MPRVAGKPVLTPGDVLIAKGTFDSVSHFFISIGQALCSHNMPFSKSSSGGNLVHAGIYVGTDAAGKHHLLAEAVGDGASVNPIDPGHTFLVFRYKDAGLASAVALTAKNWASPDENDKNSKKMLYCYGRLISSVFTMSYLGKKGKSKVDHLATQTGTKGAPKNAKGEYKAMICSEFAISCWNATAKAMNVDYPIKADSTSCTPKELGHKLRKSADWSEFDPWVAEKIAGGGAAP